MRAWITIIVTSFVLGGLMAGGSFAASVAAPAADDSQCASGNATCQWLFTLETDGDTIADSNGNDVNTICQFYLQQNAGALTGIWYKCNDNSTTKFSIDQISAGAVIKQTDDHKHKVASLKASASFDAVHGGPLTMIYLSQGDTDPKNDAFANYGLSIQMTGLKWVIYTGPDNGQKPFTYMFMKAKFVPILGIAEGVEKITTSYSPSSN